MRSATLLTAAFAASAFATPLGKRELDIETVTDVVYVTNVVTKTAVAASAATTAAVASPASSVAAWFHWGHHKHSSSSVAPAPTSAPVEYSAPAPAPTSEAPETTEAPLSTYVAPTSTYEAPEPTTSTQAAATTAASAGTPYQKTVVDHHNFHRANHSASNIVWDANLASIAQDIANTCVYKHNTTAGGGGYGQNIAAGVDSNSISTVISNLFYDGEVNYYNGLYGQADPDMSNFENWGHFSQIVWKGTERVGCATATCATLGNIPAGSNIPPYFTVCNYGPPGNYAGQYGNNIGQPLGKATVVGSNSLE